MALQAMAAVWKRQDNIGGLDGDAGENSGQYGGGDAYNHGDDDGDYSWWWSPVRIMPLIGGV